MAPKMKVAFPKAFAPPWHRATINPPAPSPPSSQTNHHPHHQPQRRRPRHNDDALGPIKMVNERITIALKISDEIVAAASEAA